MDSQTKVIIFLCIMIPIAAAIAIFGRALQEKQWADEDEKKRKEQNHG